MGFPQNIGIFPQNIGIFPQNIGILPQNIVILPQKIVILPQNIGNFAPPKRYILTTKKPTVFVVSVGLF